ncbi:5' nucleotidase [Vibrio phage 1.063.O._10N.261.45.C7]|nr:5' nucleotidase [Vibrio phage 1.063.O._10N.261.45.C7]
MSNKTIGVDVDNTICGIIHKWIDFCCSSSDYGSFDEERYYKDENNGTIDYNITNYFELKEGTDFLEFWKNKSLYDDVECWDEAVKAVKALYYTGWKVVFISYCNDCGTHAQSKSNMIKRCFDFIHPEHYHFVQTKSKGVFSGCLTAFVDDRNSFTNMFKGEVQCFRYNSPYTQDQDIMYGNVKEVDSWTEILEELL